MQFRYSNGSAAQSDVNQNIIYETISNGVASFGFSSVTQGLAPKGSRYRRIVLALRGVDRHDSWGRCPLDASTVNREDSKDYLMRCAGLSGTLPIPEGQLSSYLLNGNYYSAGDTQPAYSGVYVPDKPGYDVQVTNGTWNPSTRIATPNNPTNWAGTPVYGSDLQNATDSITTITYIKPAASATVHFTKDGIEDTSLQQTFNGRQDDPITGGAWTFNTPSGYYITGGTPPLTCNDTTCTLPANTTYPAGHTDYWITCQQTTPKHETWNATLTVHYQDDTGTTLRPDQSKTITLTRDYTIRPDTATIIVPGDWTYPGSDPNVTWQTTGGNRRNLTFSTESPTIPGYHTNQPTATYTNNIAIDHDITAGGNNIQEITVTYHRMITALPFTGGIATALGYAIIGLVAAIMLTALTMALKRKQHHITTN